MTVRSTLPPPRRRLRLGMVGGGRNGEIGNTHRSAALMDGRWEVVAGALSSNPDVGRVSAADWLIASDRAYPDALTMAEQEAGRPDRIDAVCVCTPNSLHHAASRAFLDRGIHVISDKPMTTRLDDALDLVQAVRSTGLVFALTHHSSGYPLVRLARDMVRAGELGEIRSVAVEYIAQYQAELSNPDEWRNDPARSGPLGIVADIGTHAHHLAQFVTGLTVTELSAELTRFVPGRQLDDHATMLLRFDNGARGHLWVTALAVGNENLLRIRVYGSKGGLEWDQENPNLMRVTRLGQQPRLVTKAGLEDTEASRAACRPPAGHAEGYIEAFANIYREVAEVILAREEGRPPSPLALQVPTVEDGARGVRFMLAALESADAGGEWVDTSLRI
jgi:predicted dehydrogenase